jgi:hypothetical protein
MGMRNNLCGGVVAEWMRVIPALRGNVELYDLQLRAVEDHGITRQPSPAAAAPGQW